MTAPTTRRQQPGPLMDVDQATGRLLSVNELRRALQLARQGATAMSPTTSSTDTDLHAISAAHGSTPLPPQSGTADDAHPTGTVPADGAPPPPTGEAFTGRARPVDAPLSSGSSAAASERPALNEPSAGRSWVPFGLGDSVQFGVDPPGASSTGLLAPGHQRTAGSTADRAGAQVDDHPTDLDSPSAEAGVRAASGVTRPDQPRSRRRAVRFARTVLGLNRSEREPRRRHHRKGGQRDVDWLAGLDDPAADSIADDAPAADPRQGTANAAPAEPAARATRSAAATDELVMTAAPRGFTAVLWLWVARLAVAVIFLAGVNQVFVKPFHHETAAAATVTLDVAASQQAAARYVSDYLTFLPGHGPAQLAALQGDVAGATGAGRVQWSGTGYLRADSVLPGQVVPIDSGRSLVSVAALIHTAMPPAGRNTDAATTGTATAAADPGPVPAGWTDLGTRWIQLTVPVQSTGADVRASGAGPVFSGETPQLITEPDGAQVDEDITTATAGAGRSLLTGYAASNLSYLTAPDVSLTGLHGVVTALSVSGWSVSRPPDSTATAIATASVTWQLAGTDLTISQPYAMALTHSLGRWYGAALGPDPAGR